MSDDNNNTRGAATWHRADESAMLFTPEPLEELRRWWLDTTIGEIESVVPKAIEYGSADLDIVGYSMAKIADKHADVSNDELGIAFYVLGKVSRLIGAYADGRKPSDDTWHDIAIYTKMAQRARAAGNWPGVEL